MSTGVSRLSLFKTICGPTMHSLAMNMTCKSLFFFFFRFSTSKFLFDWTINFNVPFERRLLDRGTAIPKQNHFFVYPFKRCPWGPLSVLLLPRSSCFSPLFTLFFYVMLNLLNSENSLDKSLFCPPPMTSKQKKFQL